MTPKSNRSPKEVTPAYSRTALMRLWRSIIFVASLLLLAPAARGEQLILVKDIYAGAESSRPAALGSMGEVLFFRADDGIHGAELWRSDGTEEGTWLVRDIYPGSTGSEAGALFGGGGVILEDMLVFAADDGIHGHELWKSDGTEEGTVLIRDIWAGSGDSSPALFRRWDNLIYFNAAQSESGQELWKSDGTEEGTVIVKDINPGVADSNPVSMEPFGEQLFFRANDGIHGEEMWKTDGTNEGTVLFTDIRPGIGSSRPRGFVEFGAILVFNANDGIHGDELWKSDGTPEGTLLVKNINPAVNPPEFPDSTIRDSSPRILHHMGDRLLIAARTADLGSELWTTDGTETGTVLLKDIFPGILSSYPDRFGRIGDQFFFKARPDINPTGFVLWATDGTEQGTRIVKDTYPARETQNPMPILRESLSVGDRIYFTADDYVHGAELWKSDGTESGTFMVQDLWPGMTGSIGRPMLNENNRVFCAADQGIGKGTELYVLVDSPPPPPPPQPDPTGRLANISTRGLVGTDGDVMIGGFIIEGTGPKTVLIRGRGPSLSSSGLSGLLSDPAIQLFSGGTLLASNDNWEDAGQSEDIQATGLAPAESLESVILRSLDPGAYTVILSGTSASTGTGIVEIFDVDDDTYVSMLKNLSTRGRVQTSDSVMIGGFIIEGTEARTVVLRARGPSLAGSGVSGALADPYLRLFSGGTQLDFNDDWQAGSNASEITASGLAPSDSNESALYRTLSPGAYTVIVEGVGGTIGIGIVEAFDVTEE